MKVEDLIAALPDNYSLEDREMILRACRVAEEAHKNQTRASGEPYIKEQYDFYDRISKSLVSIGYSEISYAELTEVVYGVSFPEGVKIFGPQVTVEYALFHDLLELCPEAQ